MSAVPPRARRSRNTLRLWTYEQAKEAVPYVGSILRSLREYHSRIESLNGRIKALDDEHGRPGRSTLIAIQEARREEGQAQQDFDSALEELNSLDMQLADPARGTALVPFAHDDQLAWYIFDLDESNHLRSWRYHSDPDETRRKLTHAMTR